MKSVKIFWLLVCFVVTLHSSEDLNLLKKECSLDISDSCVKLGAFYEFKKKEYKVALKFFEKSCDLYHPMGCFVAANLYNDGKLGKKDKNMALQLYEKSCSLGFSGSCIMAEKVEREIFSPYSFGKKKSKNKHCKMRSKNFGDQVDYSNLSYTEKQFYADILNYIFRGTIGDVRVYQVTPNVAKAGDFFLLEIATCSHGITESLAIQYGVIYSQIFDILLGNHSIAFVKELIV